MWAVFEIVVFVSGFAVCWISKDKLVQLVIGTETFIKALEAKAAALKAVL
jgi:hypothetical protein